MFITYEDLAAFTTIERAKAEQMIEDVEAQAALAAPCLGDPDTTLTEMQVKQVKSVLRQALLRRIDAGNAGTRTNVTQTVGPWSQGQTVEVTGSRGLFWPTEITDLQKICQAAGGKTAAGAFTIDMTGLPQQLDPLAGVIVNGDASALTPLEVWP